MKGSCPLFVFATRIEFNGVFPKYADCKPDANNLIWCGSGYACILQMGAMRYAVLLHKLITLCAASGICFSCVISLGICGAYPNRNLNILDVVRIDSDIEADLGYFKSDNLFVSKAQVLYASNPADAPFDIASLKSANGVTVNSCTGTLKMGLERSKMFNADIETMEGAACFFVCQILHYTVYQVRAVSNFASNRNKKDWKISEALDALRNALSQI